LAKKIEIDSCYVEVHSSHRVVYIRADGRPIASVELIQVYNAVKVSVNCKEKQVLASYQKHFSKSDMMEFEMS